MQASRVVRNPRALGPLGLMRELARARRTGPEPETVFRLLRPFHGPALDGIFARVLADPTGRRILEAGRSLQPVLLDLDRLRSLPSGTLGREYARFLDDNGIDIVSFAEASLRHMAPDDYADPRAWTLVNRLRDIHELVHLVSGYGTDVLGEMCELAFNIHEDPRPAATRFAIRVNSARFRRQGLHAARPAIREAFERGDRVGLMVATDWEAHLADPLEDVRARLTIDAPRHYRPGPADQPPPHLLDLVRAPFLRL